MYLCVAWAAYANPCGCVVGFSASSFLVMDVRGCFFADVANGIEEQEVGAELTVLTHPLTLLAAYPFKRRPPQRLACSG